MSDIGLIFPWWFTILFLGAVFWLLTLALGLVSVAATLFTRGLARIGAAALTIAFAAELAFAAMTAIRGAAEDRATGAFEARIHQTLDHALVVDGLALPAGTDVQWSDESRRRLRSASLPAPTPLLGIRLTYVSAMLRQASATQVHTFTPNGLMQADLRNLPAGVSS